jgi:SAM-dependent methyltransferase
MPDRTRADLRELTRAFRETDKTRQHDSKRHDEDVQALRGEIAALREEVHQRLLQYHLQLGRLAEGVDGRGPSGGLGTRLPVSAPDAADRPPAPAPSSGTANEWLDLTACPACRCADRTIVCEWNKLVLLDTAPDEQAARYDYAVCHGCGILYATHRPVGSRYRYLVDHFEDVIDKDARNPLLNPHPLTDADRERYRKLLARGVFVSDHVDDRRYLEGVFKDRLENAPHVDIIGSLVDPRGARVLEIRPRAGTIGEGLRRLYGAVVHAMPIWESQGFIVQELYGIPVSSPIDFDRFSIPHDEPFDLIVCNHMFNHAVRLDGFLKAVRDALRPGGHLYLYNEIDDGEFLQGGQSMIATMNPLHLQAADTASLARAVGAAGFEPVFIKERHKRNLCLMKKTSEPRPNPIGRDALEQRIAAYRRARDRAVLRAPERVRHRFADVWDATVERAVASDVARFDERGDLRLVKQP